MLICYCFDSAVVASDTFFVFDVYFSVVVVIAGIIVTQYWGRALMMKLFCNKEKSFSIITKFIQLTYFVAKAMKK